ncbi:MAG: hypothetical protein ACRDKI_03710 [Solirubrobacterales bacterium]
MTSIALALAFTWFLLRTRVSLALAVILQGMLVAAGLAVLAGRGDGKWTTVGVFGASLVAMAVGYWASARWHESRDRQTSTPRVAPTFRPLPDIVVWSVVIVACGLASYHFVKAGVPFLSGSLDRDRFDFTSSGLFGIPGRMYLYGTTFVWAFACANATAREIKWRRYKPWLVSTVFLFGTTLLSGFKGALLSLAITVVGVFVIVTGANVRFGEMLRKYWWLAGVPVAYFFFVATLYKYYTYSSAPLWQQLLDRATIVGAAPAQLLLEGRGSLHFASTLPGDFQYFLIKYTGGTPTGVPLDRAVSAQMINVDAQSAAWTPPVTLSGFAEISYYYTIVAGYLAMLLSGAWLAHCDFGRVKSVAQLTFRAIVVLTMYDWLLKGELAYNVLNSLAVAGMLAAVAFFTYLTFGAAAAEPRAAPRPFGPAPATDLN